MRQRFILALMLPAALAVSVPVYAQSFQPRKPRPDWGIFGSGVANTGQKLILTVNFGAGYEDDLTKNPAPAPPVDPDNPADPTTPPVYAGVFSSAGANLKYSVDKDRVYGDMQFGAYGRNYKDMTDPFVGTYSTSGNLSFSLSKRATLNTSAYAGQYLQNLAPPGYSSGSGFGMPGVPQAPSDIGAFTTGDTYRGFGASANYSHNLTTKLSATAAYAYYANDSWSATPTDARYDSQYASAGARYSLGKGLGLRGGYSATLGGFTAGQPGYRGRTIDAGVDFNKSLSPTRKSRLSFATGMSGVVDLADKTHYYFVGNVNFTNEIGRSWSLYASANQSVNFYQTLGQPTVNDSVTAGLGGLIGRQVNVNGGISWYQGRDIATGTKAYDSANASVHVQWGFSRIFALGGDYTYYRYKFTESVALLPPGFLDHTDRQTVNVSLIVWMPLFTQARRSNASR